MTKSEYTEIAVRKSGEFMGLYSMIDFICSIKLVEYFMGKEASEKKAQLFTHIHHKFSLENKLDIIAKDANEVTLRYIGIIKENQKIRNVFAHSMPHIPKGLDKIQDPNKLNELFYTCLRKYDKNWTRENGFIIETYVISDLDKKIKDLYNALENLK